MSHFKLVLAVFVIFTASLVCAESVENLDFCTVTKITINDYEPEKFEPSNNLLRKAGEEEIFCGKKIIIHGRVLDQNCVPVSDAKVYIWQASCNGKYPYKPLKNIVKKSSIDINREFTFTGNGTATTNNNGEFTFITIYPPSMHDLLPHVNIRAEHYMLGTLQTTLTLDGKKVNNPNDKLGLQSIAEAVETTGTNIYDFEIVLPGSGIKDYTNGSD